MPLSGFPVFRLSPRRQVANRLLLSWTSAPLQGVYRELPRRASCDVDPARTGDVADFPAALLGVPCSSAHAAARVHDGGRCHVPPVPRSRRFYAFNGQSTFRSTLFGLPGLFHPGNARELPSTGLSSSRSPRPVSGSFLPCRFAPRSGGPRGFEGFLPPRIGLSSRARERPPETHAPLTFPL